MSKIVCKNCKYWQEAENDYDMFGKCINKHVYSEEVDTGNKDPMVEMASIRASYYDTETFSGLETAAFFGCIHGELKGQNQ